MATRNYTEEAYDRIKQTIAQIDENDMDPVLDFFGDLISKIGEALGLTKYENYQANVQDWYNKVLDSHDTTMSKVDSIFSAVESVDTEYSKTLKNACTSIANFQSALNCLRDVISGKSTLADGKASAESYIADGKSTFKPAYAAILTKAESRTREDAGKELIKDALSLGRAYTGIRAAILTGNPAKVVSACKKFADTFVATTFDVAAVTGIVGTALVGYRGAKTGMDYEDYLDYRYKSLMTSRKLKDINSATDLLDAAADELSEDLEECPKDSPCYGTKKALSVIADGLAVTSHAVDTAADVYDIYSDVTDFASDIHDWKNGKSYTEEELAKASKEGKKIEVSYSILTEKGEKISISEVPKSEIVGKLITRTTGISASGWDDPQKAEGNVYKTLGTIWTYVDKVSDGEDAGAVAVGQIQGVKNGKKIIDRIEDLSELITGSDTDTYSADGGDFSFGGGTNADSDAHAYSAGGGGFSSGGGGGGAFGGGGSAGGRGDSSFGGGGSAGGRGTNSFGSGGSAGGRGADRSGSGGGSAGGR